MDHLFDATDDTREELENTINKDNNAMNRGIEKSNGNETPKDKDYENGNEPSNNTNKVNKLEVKLNGSLSEIYTNALQEVLNKQTGLNEYQVMNEKEIKDKAKNEVKKGNIGKESQQQSVDMIAANQYLSNDPNYYKSLDDESVDPDYYYNYIGKNTDINNSEDVINAINRIISGYNKKYSENNAVVLENNNIINKHIINLECLLEGLDIKLHIVNKEKILPTILKTLKQ